MMRANVSAAPPGVEGAMMRIGRSGHAASAGDVSAALMSAPIMAAHFTQRIAAGITLPPLGLFLRPHLARNIDHALELRHRLIVAHDRVALLRGGEAALRRQRETFEINHARAFADTRFDEGFGFEFGDLGRENAEHGGLVCG